MHTYTCIVVILQKNYPELADIDMAIPIFHCYGHQGSCQVSAIGLNSLLLYLSCMQLCTYYCDCICTFQLTLNPRRKVNFGMADGEWTERIWSSLRPYAYITKEQTAGHREDTLTLAALYLGNKKNSVLGTASSAILCHYF